MQKLLTFDDLVSLGYVKNRVTLGRWIKDNKFPKPITIGSRGVAWLKSELDEWESVRIVERDSARRNSANA